MIDTWVEKIDETPDDLLAVDAACRSAVQSSVDYTDEAFWRRPLSYERHHRKLPQKIDPPKTAKRFCRHGLDATGHVRIMESFTNPGDPWLVSYIEYQPPHILVASVVNDGTKRSVRTFRKLTVEGNRIVKAWEKESSFSREETYDYSDGRVTAIRCEIRSAYARALKIYTTLVCYDADGNAKSFDDKYPPNSPFDPEVQAAKRKAAKKRFADPKARAKAVAELKAALCKEIPALAAAAAGSKEAYSVLMAHEDDGSLPPLLAIGLVQERDHWLAQHGTSAKDYFWNPAEYSLYETPGLQFSESTSDLADALTTVLSKTDRLAFLDDLGRALLRSKWPATFARSDDFVIAAVDFELARLAKSLKAINPPEIIASLKKKKWL